jgi:hypothetical protein
MNAVIIHHEDFLLLISDHVIKFFRFLSYGNTARLNGIVLFESYECISGVKNG